MKRNAYVLVLLIGLAASFTSCNQSSSQKTDEAIASKLPVMTLTDSASYDFGTVTEGDIVEHTFHFRNDGEFPLILNNITSSCGCTTPEWPKEPIGPKEESSIVVRFDTKNKTGPQVKTITVYANTEPAFSELKLRGIVDASGK
ncbi:uncharacterized protein DUF1573 [Dyadobacter jejuensis]|uniref:Uncharacterized protein DUF1573 n=1 Tax=Dyadobacter jejuensis TaxID=1082580 RepID=A0A316AKH2_9BACT|nr:DUF1573 domain-containing protein [Dyadobacter jejuensis]PWJ58275.1 uncharacterized protein DUF1573 [Dyadobacter jejuensis]